jgi:hypothetical protein
MWSTIKHKGIELFYNSGSKKVVCEGCEAQEDSKRDDATFIALLVRSSARRPYLFIGAETVRSS